MAPQGVVQEGWAYVYAPEHQGRQTASGESFAHEDFTGAHRTLPLGSRVRVTNLSNRRSATVRITDRGPYIATRIVDLSAAAAREIGMTRGGARVRLELTNGPLAADAKAAIDLDDASRRSDGRAGSSASGTERSVEYTLQLGSFSDEAAASQLARRVEGGWLYKIRVGDSDFFRVNFGIFPTAAEAERALANLQTQGIRGFVKTVEEVERQTVIDN